MKKKIFLILLCLCAASACVLGLTGCPNSEPDPDKHTEHTYTEKVTSAEYLKSEATCTQKAVYYYSCTCGEKGTETFEFGELVNHKFTEEKAEDKYLKSEANCTQKAVYYKSCSVCGEKGTETFSRGDFAHKFTEEKAESKYLKSAATCTSKAIYYKCCSVCGVKGEETFEHGEKLPHAYTESAANADHLKTSATCKTSAVYYKSCPYCRENGEETFVDGYPKGHTFENGKCKICEVLEPTEGIYYNLSSENNYSYSVSGISAGATDVVIADIYGSSKRPVTAISQSAFKDRTSITSIVIPDGVKAIGYDAFKGCTSLQSITIPESVTEIGGRAFSGCSSLKSVVLPSNVTSVWALFENCTSLESVTLPENLTDLGFDTFKGCTKLKNITLPDGLTDIDRRAFENTAFYNTAANWENNVLYSGKYLIAARQYISGAYQIKQGTLAVAESAFAGCNNLTGVTIPEGVKYIDGYAFNNCAKLANVNLPQSLKSIGDWAFANCALLANITLPDGLTEIGGSVLRGTAFYEDESNWENGLLYVGKYLIAAKNDISGEVAIKPGTLAVADGTFGGCASLTSVTIPEGVTLVSYGLFQNCSSLTSVTIPSSVTVIDGYAFGGCNSLGGITLPDGLTFIGSSAFEFCKSLQSITIPESVTYIGKNAFNYCYALIKYCEAAKKPEGWLDIWYSDVVWDCKNNDKDGEGFAYTVIDGITYSVKDGEATVIKQPANLTSAVILEKVTYKGEDYTVTSFGNGTFSDCSLLESVTIPAGILKISWSAFHGCGKLEEINYAGTKEQWAEITADITDYYSNFVVHCSNGDINIEKNAS